MKSNLLFKKYINKYLKIENAGSGRTHVGWMPHIGCITNCQRPKMNGEKKKYEKELGAWEFKRALIAKVMNIVQKTVKFHQLLFWPTIFHRFLPRNSMSPASIFHKKMSGKTKMNKSTYFIVSEAAERLTHMSVHIFFCLKHICNLNHK